MFLPLDLVILRQAFFNIYILLLLIVIMQEHILFAAPALNIYLLIL